MARKTKAEKLALQERERRRAMDQQINDYPALLMRILEFATEMNYELRVKEGQFVLHDRDGSSYDDVVLTQTYSDESLYRIEMLEGLLECKAEQEREANRRLLVRQSALAKLSAEEREILGI